MKQILNIIFIVACISGCTHRTKIEEEPIVRLDLILASYAGRDSVQKVEELDSFRTCIDAMFAVLGIDSVSPPVLDSWSRSRVVEVFQPAVDSAYPDLTGLSSQIGHILQAARHESLDLPDLEFATVVWGNPRPMVRIDSVVLMALNHYLGQDYPGYAGWPEYRRANKTSRMMQYDVASVLAATQYPMEMGADATLLNWMLYEGALVEARMRLVGKPELHEALGYTQEQLEFARKHLYDMWQEMSVRQMIYDTDPLIIDRFVAPAPASPLMRSEAPGRIGCYVGYRIVKDYLARYPDTTLPKLLSKNFYGSQQTLIKSGFTGR